MIWSQIAKKYERAQSMSAQNSRNSGEREREREGHTARQRERKTKEEQGIEKNKKELESRKI